MTTTIQPDGLHSRATESRDPRGYAAETIAVERADLAATGTTSCMLTDLRPS